MNDIGCLFPSDDQKCGNNKLNDKAILFFILFRVVWLCTILSVTECLFSLINTIIKCVAWIERKNGKDGKKNGCSTFVKSFGVGTRVPESLLSVCTVSVCDVCECWVSSSVLDAMTTHVTHTRTQTRSAV